MGVIFQGIAPFYQNGESFNGRMRRLETHNNGEQPQPYLIAALQVVNFAGFQHLLVEPGAIGAAQVAARETTGGRQDDGMAAGNAMPQLAELGNIHHLLAGIGRVAPQYQISDDGKDEGFGAAADKQGQTAVRQAAQGFVVLGFIGIAAPDDFLSFSFCFQLGVLGYQGGATMLAMGGAPLVGMLAKNTKQAVLSIW